MLSLQARRSIRGFTLIELVTVIVILGVAAVFLAPRLTAGDFTARGFHDETLAFLRYAQKTAIAQRRTVCVAFTANSATLTVVSSAGNSACPGAVLMGPNGEASAQIPTTAQQRYMTGITYGQYPVGGFFFNALGQPSAGQTLRVASNGVMIPQTIVVEAETGYVHD